MFVKKKQSLKRVLVKKIKKKRLLTFITNVDRGVSAMWSSVYSGDKVHHVVSFLLDLASVFLAVRVCVCALDVVAV